MKEKMIAAVSDFLEGELGYWKQPDGTFEYEIYADYRDEMDHDTAIKILESDDPMQTFYEKMDEWYFDYSFDVLGDLKSHLVDLLEDDDGPFPEGLTDEEDGFLEDVLRDMVYFAYPYRHFLKQEFYVNIMVDTGDGNYDYTLNGVYPSYCGRYEDRINDKASIVWLARQQGYTKTELWRALREGDMANPKGFLESMRVEVANIASHMQALTFLVEMTLEELIGLNGLIKLQDRNGHFYDSTKNPYCGYIILDQKTEAGLYDPWQGGGSCFEIELEKDVRLPIRFIRSALPDGGDGYAVKEVYGMCGSAWKKGGIKAIRAPKQSFAMGKVAT